MADRKRSVHVKQLLTPRAVTRRSRPLLYRAEANRHISPKKEWIVTAIRSEAASSRLRLWGNAMRDSIVANQKRLGVVISAESLSLTNGPNDLPKWETPIGPMKRSCSLDRRRYTQLYAYTDTRSAEWSRPLEEPGKTRQHVDHLHLTVTTAHPEGTLLVRPIINRVIMAF